jgi:uncharacterized protein YecE (DUF72 family)
LGLPASRWLEFYAEQFSTVEVNNTFYRLPSPETFDAWARRVPRTFIYAVKASRFLTHLKKLKDPEAPLELMLSRVRRLRHALGPILYQLPPRWPFNPERLRAFARALPRGFSHVVEFRDPSWYNDEALSILARRRVALCMHDMAGSASLDLARGAELPEVRGAVVYCRFHGPRKYNGRYPDENIERVAAWLPATSTPVRRSMSISTTTPEATLRVTRRGYARRSPPASRALTRQRTCSRRPTRSGEGAGLPDPPPAGGAAA